jgi:Na+(H+)/acetate symporter ActP
MTIDPWILAFSALTVIATIWMGFWSAKRSKTAHDFYVAGRSVSVGWNASAISGEYLSAASFMGVAGMVMSSGYDTLWYPVCYACGYLFLLLFIAGPLRRFGAYTIPDFAEGRFDSPLFRKIAVTFVLFIGFFYTMPQMKGAGTTLAYIFPGMPYWGGVVLVGAVITLNVVLGGMKGITLVQAFQYWLKMFAISVPIFVLMAVYGHYGDQLGLNARSSVHIPVRFGDRLAEYPASNGFFVVQSNSAPAQADAASNTVVFSNSSIMSVAAHLSAVAGGMPVFVITNLGAPGIVGDLLTNYGPMNLTYTNSAHHVRRIERWLGRQGVALLRGTNEFIFLSGSVQKRAEAAYAAGGMKALQTREFVLGCLYSSFTCLSYGQNSQLISGTLYRNSPTGTVIVGHQPVKYALSKLKVDRIGYISKQASPLALLDIYSEYSGKTVWASPNLPKTEVPLVLTNRPRFKFLNELLHMVETQNVAIVKVDSQTLLAVLASELHRYQPLLESEVTRAALPAKAPRDETWISPFGPLTTKAAQAAGLSTEEGRPFSLLYTYSLIIALVCGTAGLPHILVRFYTNPDGVAAKRTTMWVMILIGVFYLFPPVFGVMGRNLLPELYAATGATGTDKIVLELPRILNEKVPMLGSIMSGITCAGAFAAFMSTFSGLLVSITGALAHDIYGRILRPKSTPDERMRAFKVFAVVGGTCAILLGFLVENFEINKLVGWAFAIAATSYFPLLFMSTWWRRITMKGAATGMLVGGTLSLIAIASTMFADQARWAAGLESWYAQHPLERTLAEQPAIWALPLAIVLMFVISKLTQRTVPPDIRMKMLVLHAPEKLGLKQEYIQEHQPGH